MATPTLLAIEKGFLTAERLKKLAKVFGGRYVPPKDVSYQLLNGDTDLLVTLDKSGSSNLEMLSTTAGFQFRGLDHRGAAEETATTITRIIVVGIADEEVKQKVAKLSYLFEATPFFSLGALQKFTKKIRDREDSKTDTLVLLVDPAVTTLVADSLGIGLSLSSAVHISVHNTVI